MLDREMFGHTAPQDGQVRIRNPERPFEPELEALRSLSSSKWSNYGADVLPAFIAEMDFPAAAAVRNALRDLVTREDYGYPRVKGEALDRVLAKAFALRMGRRFGWQVDPALVLAANDIVQATMATVLAYSQPGDGIVVHAPCYPPFISCVRDSGREFVPLDMVDDGKQYFAAVDEVRSRVGISPKMMILCNPHNPTGRVFTRAELEELAKFAVERDLIVVSDEIHADLIFPGSHHIPFASLSEDVAERTVTLNSATKSFNIPGLRCAVICFGSADLRKRFESVVSPRLLGQPNVFGVHATLAAWSDGDAWLEMLIGHLTAVRDVVTQRLEREVPEIRFYSPQGSYLLWLDCSALGLSGSAYSFFLEKAGIAFSAGETFKPGCEHYVRMNFATSLDLAHQMVDRIKFAIGDLRSATRSSSEA